MIRMIRPSKLSAVLGAGALFLSVAGVLAPGAASAATTAAAPVPTAATRTAGPHRMAFTTPGPVRAAAPSGAHLTYYGGPVVSNAKVENVFYGTGTFGPSAGPGGSMPSFFNAVGSSAYFDWLTEYNTTVAGGTGQTIGHASSLGEVTILPSAANNGSTIDDVNMQAELAAQLTAGHLPAPTFDAQGNVNTVYSLFFPDGKTLTQGGSTGGVAGGFCAYHGTIVYQGHYVPYMVMPAFTPTSGYAHGCGADPTLFNNFTSVTSHELIETVTDAAVGQATVFGPPLGWYDGTNGEIGDICNAQQGSVAGFVVQKEFSNVANDCIATRDFSVGASPSTLTLAQGAGGTSTISTAVTSGTAAIVSLSATGVPVGANASFSPASITAGGSSTLTLNAGTAAPGPYAITVTGTQGATVHSTTINLTVTGNDFSISASPSSLTLAPGVGGTSTISTAVTTGVAATVGLSATGVPVGASASFSPASITAGGSSTLTLNAGTAAPGPYTITVTGTQGSAVHSTTVGLTVAANNFSIGASPSSLTLVQGAGGTSTISTAVTTGVAATVGLSATGVPVGASASFSPASITAGGSSTLTLNAGTAAPGSYTITVTGTEGSAVHSTTVTLNIPGNDFTISASPGTVTVLQGGSVTSAIGTTVASGVAGPVSLSATGVPVGGSASFSPASITAGGSSTLTLYAGTAAPGSYTITVTGIEGAASHSTTVALTVVGAPDAPLSPAAVAGHGDATVSWTAPASNGGWPLLSYTVTAVPGAQTCTAPAPQTSCVVSGLDPFGSFSFTVRATNGNPVNNAPGLTGPAASTSSAVQPTATAPAITGAVPGNASVTVTWTGSLPAPTSYTVSSTQGKVAGPTCSSTSTSCVVAGLTNGKAYTFIVTANFASGTTVSGPSTAAIPKIFADLAASNSATAMTLRSGAPLTVVEGVTNHGPQAATAKLLITVANASEAGMTPDAGLSCAAPVPNVAGTGFTQACTTSAPLASGATLSATLSLHPLPLPPVTSLITVSAAVSLPVTVPATYSDPVSSNNKVTHVVKVVDRADLSASFTGGPSVGRTGNAVVTGTITNLGLDPVFAKFTIIVAKAAELSVAPDSGLTCGAPVANAAGTGFSQACTTSAPLAPGGSLHVQLTLAPSANPAVHGLTVTGAVVGVGGTIADAVAANNKSVLPVAIIDSANLAATLGPAAPTVARTGTVTLTGTISNTGPDTVSGRVTIAVVDGTILSATADPGLSCTGTGATRTCTLTTPLPPGTTLTFSVVVVPSQVASVVSLTATSTVTVLGGVTVSDPDASNDVASTTIAIV
jgi:hypothetical protein